MYVAITYISQRFRSALIGYNPPISDERQFVNARAYLRTSRMLKICHYTTARCVYYIQFKVREAALSVMPKEFKVTTAALYVIRVRNLNNVSFFALLPFLGSYRSYPSLSYGGMLCTPLA